MTKISDNINSYQNLAAYDSDMGKEYPNVSYLIDEDEVKLVKDDPLLVVKYNVTSTSSATRLLNSSSGITYQIIDGVQQQSVQMNYTFDTLGEHIVKYKLKGTNVVSNIFNACYNLTSVTIPYGFTYIGSDAFLNCYNLTNAVIPNSVTSIGGSAFKYASIRSINIPNSVTVILQQTFSNCTKLSNVTIGTGITSIGESAFTNCTGLTSVTIQATTPPTLNDAYVFYNTNANLVFYVPAESLETYKATNRWNTYASRIQAIPTT